MKVGPTEHGRIHRTISACGSVTAMRCAIGPLLFALQLAVPLVHAATTAPTANGPLRVVTTPIAPFVLPDTDSLAGFSVDVWNEVARRCMSISHCKSSRLTIGFRRSNAAKPM